MPTNKTDRFSQITVHKDPLTGAETFIPSQMVGSARKTNTATIDTLKNKLKSNLDAENITNHQSFGFGIVGDGSTANPLAVDKTWADSLFLQSNNGLSFSQIGDRATRYLPISINKQFKSNAFKSSLGTDTSLPLHGPAVNVEVTGELKLLQPGLNGLHTVSYGAWDTERNLDSEQLIERKFKAANLNTAYSIVEVFGKSATAALVRAIRIADSTYHYFYVTLTDGSLFQAGFNTFLRLGDDTSAIGAAIKTGSAVAFATTKGKFVLVMPYITSATSPTSISGYSVTTATTAGEATIIAIPSWTTSSYVGLQNTTDLRISDKVVGSSSEKCELVSHASFNYSVTNNSNEKTRFLSVIQDRLNPDNVVLYLRGYVKITPISDITKSYKYNYDIGYKLTMAATKSTAIALASYTTGKPTVTMTTANVPTITNQRNTFVDYPNSMQSEFLQVLPDGSILTAINCVTGTETPMNIRKSAVGVTGVSMDIHASIDSGLFDSPLSMNFKPGYTGTATNGYRLYISSPIKYILGNGGRGVIPAQILELDSTLKVGAALKAVSDLPHIYDAYRNTYLHYGYLYLQHTGTQHVLVMTYNYIEESPTNMFVGLVGFDSDGKGITSFQASSRLHVYRPSYVPQGSSIPVSYDNPAEYPKSFWLDRVSSASTTTTADVFLYTPADGTVNFIVKAGETVVFTLVGGGGGGGGSIHNYSSSNYWAFRDGYPGGDASIEMVGNESVVYAKAGGGKGGIGANWGNGSSFSNGSPGAGGTNTDVTSLTYFLTLANLAGTTPPVVNRYTRQPGGTSVTFDVMNQYNGAGGQGAWGTGDENWSYGCGGGSGGVLVKQYTNTNSTDVVFKCIAGRAGLGFTPNYVDVNGNPSDPGIAGCIMVERLRK